MDFCGNDISAAIKELEGITTEESRKHLQKLVYINLIDRFDILIDRLILWLVIHKPNLRNEVLKSVENEQISRQEVFEIFL